MIYPYYECTYSCPVCGGVYTMSNPALRCLVLHPPGSCCHIYERKLNDTQLPTTENTSNGVKEAVKESIIRP